MTSEQRSESVVDKRQHSSLTEDSNSNGSSSASLNSGGSNRSDRSVDIENGGSVDDGLVDVDLPNTVPLPAVMSVADSLSPVKPDVQHPHEASSSVGHNSKLGLNHHVSHLYTIEAILGLNNPHTKGISDLL